MDRFTTHTGEVVSGERLKAAFNKVADDWAIQSRNDKTRTIDLRAINRNTPVTHTLKINF